MRSTKTKPSSVKATEGRFEIIPQTVLNKRFKGKLVHVEGWASGCVFVYLETVLGVHHLMTPKTGRFFHTSNRLMFTRRQKVRNSISNAQSTVEKVV